MYSMSPPDVLAAMQACMIYLIMYIIDYTPGDEVYIRDLRQALLVGPTSDSGDSRLTCIGSVFFVQELRQRLWQAGRIVTSRRQLGRMDLCRVSEEICESLAPRGLCGVCKERVHLRCATQLPKSAPSLLEVSVGGTNVVSVESRTRGVSLSTRRTHHFRGPDRCTARRTQAGQCTKTRYVECSG